MSWLLGSSNDVTIINNGNTGNDNASQAANDSGGLWGFVSTLKKKGGDLVSAVSKDFNEFSASLNDETKDLMKPSATTAATVPATTTDGAATSTTTVPSTFTDATAAGTGGEVKASSDGTTSAGGRVLHSLTDNLERIGGHVENIGGKVWGLLPNVFGMSGADDEPSIASTGAPDTLPTVTRAPERSFKSKLETMQATRMSYLMDPKEGISQDDIDRYRADFENRYEAFCDSPELINILTNSHVRSFYDELVPDVVPDRIFWCRYLLRVHLLEQEEERRQTLLARIATPSTNAPVRDDLSWDDDLDTTAATTATTATATTTISAPPPSSSSSTNASTSASPPVATANPSSIVSSSATPSVTPSIVTVTSSSSPAPSPPLSPLSSSTIVVSSQPSSSSSSMRKESEDEVTSESSGSESDHNGNTVTSKRRSATSNNNGNSNTNGNGDMVMVPSSSSSSADKWVDVKPKDIVGALTVPSSSTPTPVVVPVVNSTPVATLSPAAPTATPIPTATVEAASTTTATPVVAKKDDDDWESWE